MDPICEIFYQLGYQWQACLQMIFATFSAAHSKKIPFPLPGKIANGQTVTVKCGSWPSRSTLQWLSTSFVIVAPPPLWFFFFLCVFSLKCQAHKLTQQQQQDQMQFTHLSVNCQLNASQSSDAGSECCYCNGNSNSSNKQLQLLLARQHVDKVSI